METKVVEGQIQGGIAMGIGFALFEGAKYSNGQTLNNNFSTYKILNSTEMPVISEYVLETIDPLGPFNAKGVGEPPLIATAPAIANAVYNAIGVRIKDLPISPDKVLRKLKKKQRKVSSYETRQS